MSAAHIESNTCRSLCVGCLQESSLACRLFSVFVPHPTSLRLLCPGLDALVEQERAALLADAKAQVAYDAELAQLRLRKLQAYYTASLAVHHLTLHALRSGSSVSTIRQAELPKELLVRGRHRLMTHRLSSVNNGIRAR